MTKLILVLVGISLAIIIGLSLWADRLMDDVNERRAKVEAEFAEECDALRALPPGPGEGDFRSFDDANFAPWMDVRQAVAGLLDRRIDERASDQFFHRMETRRLALGTLREKLAEQKLSAAGYLARSRRWLSLLARGEEPDILAHYRKTVVTQEAPKGVPLPPAAEDATDAERALIARERDRLRRTLSADLMTPLLETVVK